MKYISQRIFLGNTSITNILLSIICLTSIIDALSVRIIGLIGPDYSMIGSVFAFVISFIIFQTILIIIVKIVSSYKSVYQYPSSKSFELLYRTLMVTPFISSIFLLLMIIQIIANESYQVILIPIVTFASYVPSIILLSILILKLLGWFNKKHDYITLSYTIAMSSILVNAVIFSLNLPTDLFDYGIEREPTTIQHRMTQTGLLNQPFKEAYQISSIFSFISTWVATAILLQYYSRKIGKVIYWLIVALPLLYFLGQFPPIFNYLFSSLRDSDPTLYVTLATLIFGLTKVAGGTFFAIGFLIIGRQINNVQIRNYLRFSGFGILLLFVATQANSVIISPYPPFGIIAISSMTLASLLTFVGLYLTALSVSRETNLRIEIDKKVTQLSFIKKIGIAQMEEEVYKQVLPILERTSESQDNIPTSLDNEDIKLYVKEALRALKKNQ